MWAEVRWASRREGIVHLDDLLLRRMRIGLTLAQGAVPWMDRIRSIAQPELGWDDSRWESELSHYCARWQDVYAGPRSSPRIVRRRRVAIDALPAWLKGSPVNRLRTVGLFGFVLATCAAITAAGGGWQFLGHPVAIAFLALWLVWWLAIAFGRQRGVRSKCDRSQAGILALGGLALAVLIVAVPWEYGRFSGPLPRDGWLAWMGLALFALGIGLQVAAFRSLRGMYTSRLGIQPEHRLVSSGPYRWIRHPGYLSSILCLAGIGLAMSSLTGLAVSLAVIPLILARIRQEESMLLAEFGDAYRTYQARTPRLIPGLR